MMDVVHLHLSIVVPVYNEEETLHELHQRIIQAIETWENSYELIFVNDGSTDRSLLRIDALNRKLLENQ